MTSADARSRAEQLLKQMTIEEKVGQMNQSSGIVMPLLANEKPDNLIAQGQVGSILWLIDVKEINRLQHLAVDKSRLHIPILFAFDVIHGYRTVFPIPLAMASSWDPGVEEAAQHLAGEDARAAGIRWTFTPMVDIARDSRWGRIVEGAGEDPYLGAVMAAAQVRGYQGTSLDRTDTIMATAKHFAAYGAAMGGRDYAGADISQRSLEEIYLPPFYAAAREGSGSFMAAFNEIGGVPSHANPVLLRDILRTRWRWPGLLVSDWNAVAELRNHGVAGSDGDAAALALSAGVDMDMSSQLYMNALPARAAHDPRFRALLDDAVRHVLMAKERLGLFDHPYARSDPTREAGAMLTAENRTAAREIAARSIVLLKNDGNVLPIAAAARRIAVIGALGTDANSELGSWRARGDVADVHPLIPALRAALPEAEINVTGDEIPAAVAAARRADLVLLVVGEDFDMTGEARSRAELGLPGDQQALADAVLDTGRPVVVLLMNGRPLAIDRLAARAPAILETWFLGVEAGPAIADVLTGRVNPAGRLPVGFPRASGAVPFPYDRLPSGRPADPDPAHDTTRYRDLPITPLFPFGHGLSYTAFTYSDFAVRPLPGGAFRAGVTVRNSGARAGDEVVQLYMHDPVASVSRPIQELRGFRRVALGAGEAKRVSFTLSPAQFAIWDAGHWRIEAGEIELMVGASSADIRGRASIRIAAAGEGREPAAAIFTPSSEEPIR